MELPNFSPGLAEVLYGIVGHTLGLLSLGTILGD